MTNWICFEKESEARYKLKKKIQFRGLWHKTEVIYKRHNLRESKKKIFFARAQKVKKKFG